MRAALPIALTLAGVGALAAPTRYDFPIRETPYVRPERTFVPEYLRPPTRAEREAQVRMVQPPGLALTGPRTDFVWEGGDLLFTTPEGRFRATFRDYPYNPQTVNREPVSAYVRGKSKTREITPGPTE